MKQLKLDFSSKKKSKELDASDREGCDDENPNEVDNDQEMQDEEISSSPIDFSNKRRCGRQQAQMSGNKKREQSDCEDEAGAEDGDAEMESEEEDIIKGSSDEGGEDDYQEKVKSIKKEKKALKEIKVPKSKKTKKEKVKPIKKEKVKKKESESEADVPEKSDDDEEKEEIKKPKKQEVPTKRPPKRCARVCNVCFQIAGSPIEDSGYDMLDCEQCRLPAHRRCIGEQIPFREIRPMKGQPIRIHECQRCSFEQQTGQTLKCISCFQPGGLMTNIGDQNFIHIVCAMMSDFFEIEDFGTMKFRQILPQSEIDSQLEQMSVSRVSEIWTLIFDLETS
ncbi:hypothetical protein FGO68_gene6607 [Halteria grandinella]|uniref:Uncharacterized protein n=1 Tax=Halteria grandinella TaxID=5974 RepID=A0A8J8TAX5_HALGN|nr:hypothetical protein FGO68_gene6607 [Halteria grandinella]